MRWMLAWRADPVAARLANRHYTRQSPASRQFVPPGRCLVLRTVDGTAVWVTSVPLARYARHAWAGAWVCTMFRNEGPYLSSELIREAVAASRWRFGAAPPGLGMVTFVDRARVRPKRDPGRCFLRAGFHRVGMTAGGLIALQLLPGEMPPPERPLGQLDLFAADHDELVGGAELVPHRRQPSRRELALAMPRRGPR